MSELRPYRPALPGDTLSAELWNGVQTDAHRELRSHSHGAGLPGEAISPESELKVQRVEIADTLMLAGKKIDALLLESALEPGSVRGDLEVKGDLHVGGDLILGAASASATDTFAIEYQVVSSSLSLNLGTGGFEDIEFSANGLKPHQLMYPELSNDKVRPYLFSPENLGIVGALSVVLKAPARVLVHTQLCVLGGGTRISLWIVSGSREGGSLDWDWASAVQYPVREHEEIQTGYAELNALTSPAERLDWLRKQAAAGKPRVDFIWDSMQEKVTPPNSLQYIPVLATLLLPAGDHVIQLRATKGRYYYGRLIQGIFLPL